MEAQRSQPKVKEAKKLGSDPRSACTLNLQLPFPQAPQIFRFEFRVWPPRLRSNSSLSRTLSLGPLWRRGILWGAEYSLE